jgi:hypothetical protein
MLIEAVADHTWALIRVLDPPCLPIAFYTCARGAIENSAILAWLLEPLPSVDGVVQRSIALRFREVEQQIKVVRVSSHGPDATATLSARLLDICAQADGLGYEALISKGGRRQGAGTPLPGPTDMIRDVLGQEFDYRLLSSAAHGNVWAIRGLAFTEVQAATEVARKEGFAAAFEKQVSPVAVHYTAVAVARAFALGTWRLYRYAGWSTQELPDIFESAFDQLRAIDGLRFWRS